MFSFFYKTIFYALHIHFAARIIPMNMMNVLLIQFDHTFSCQSKTRSESE